MLQLEIVLSETYNNEADRFETQTITIELEHSLLSLSKWEAKYEKPFLGKEEDRTSEEALDYVRFMILTPDVPDDVVMHLDRESADRISTYIESKQTATWFPPPRPGSNAPNREAITSELIYYWVTSYQIPWEVQTWHLNRLLTLIRIFNVKNAKPTKRGRADIAAERRLLNEQRKAQMGTQG